MKEGLTSWRQELFFFPGRITPSVAGVINPGSDGFQKLFFGQEEIAIPVHGRSEFQLFY